MNDFDWGPFAEACVEMLSGGPIVSRDPRVQLRYMEMRAAGESHNMAEMLALRTFPGVKGTDSVFMEGRKLDGSQFEGQGLAGEHHLAKAAAAGVNVAGKHYLGGLARYPGDPRAWVSGRSDVRRICEESGWECRGAVNVAGPKYDERYVPPDRYRPADDILAREAAKRCAADPSLRPAEVVQELAVKMGGVHGGG